MSKRSLLTTAPAVLAAMLLPGPAAAERSPREVTLEGTVQVRHSDDFNHERATFRQLLRTSDGRRLSLSVQGSSGVSSSARGGDDARSRIAPGARVRVKGMLRGGRLVADASEIRTLRRRSVRASVTTQKKVAVILLNFQNNTAEPWTPDQVRGTVFTNASSVNAYFQEESSGDFSLTGKVRADGDVYGWYTVPYNNTSCSFSTWANAADDAATEAGVDLSGYDNHIYVWPTTSACWWAGLAYLPGSDSYINGYPDLHTISHELGHNYGLHHASSYSCTSGGQRVSISGSCTTSEYGDPFDTMGAGSTRHSHNWHKSRIGFLPQANTQTVTSEGTYTLSPSEQTLSGQVQVLRIPRTKNSNGTVNDYYYLDFRQPYGTHFDNFSSTSAAVNGVGIRIAPGYSTITQSKLIDATPATATFSDSPLAVGGTFSDTNANVYIQTLGVSAQGATVKVSFSGIGQPQEGPKKPAPPAGPIPGEDTSGPALKVKAASQQRIGSARRLVVSAACDESCRVRTSGRISIGGISRSLSLSRVSRELRGGERVELRVKLSRRAAASVRRALLRGRRTVAILTVSAEDASGNASTKKLRIRLKL